MKIRFLLFVALIIVNSTSYTQAQTNFGKLLWADEFDTEGLPNPEIWNYEEGYIRNKELQYYTKERLENARVKDGKLIIEARKDNWQGNEITSASLHTHGKKPILYGRVEVKAKIPSALGTWPAIWMLGHSYHDTPRTRWPECGEIDIMEHLGWKPNDIMATVHTKTFNWDEGKTVKSTFMADKPYEDFHVYAVNWYPDRLDFYYDDNLYHTFYNQHNTNAEWPFDKPCYLILNLAFGGAGGKKGIDKEALPLQYEIDYVRVFELNNQ